MKYKSLNEKMRCRFLLLGISALMIMVSNIWPQSDTRGNGDKGLPSSNKKSVGPKDIERTKADQAWKRIGNLSYPSEPIDGVESFGTAAKKWGSGSPAFKIWLNKVNLRYREEGLKFWKQFPNDRRRYTWLKETMWSPPHYWQDWEKASLLRDSLAAPVDMKAQKAWDNVYLQLRAEYMASPEVSAENRGQFRSQEFLYSFWRHRAVAEARGEKPDLAMFAIGLLDLASEVNNRFVIDGANNLLISMSDDPQTEAAFIEAMNTSSNVDLQLFAAGKEQISKLRSTPMDLQMISMTGEKIDVAKLRGKIVLVDIWSNNCQSCIEAMPKVQAVYDKYRDQGFEVVGVWLAGDETKEKPRAVRYLTEQGATWPNGVLTGAAMEEFKKRYSIIGVPVTFLLDKNGLLVTNDVSGPKLEQEVKRLLGL